MATHASTLAWRIPWPEEPGRLQSLGLLRAGHDSETSLSLSLSCIGEGNGNPLQCSCLENPSDRGAWWAAIYGVTQSRKRLKRLSSSSSSKLSEENDFMTTVFFFPVCPLVNTNVYEMPLFTYRDGILIKGSWHPYAWFSKLPGRGE